MLLALIMPFLPVPQIERLRAPDYGPEAPEKYCLPRISLLYSIY
jgi:hypothetical protein